MDPFRDRVAVVTGAASGIGLAMARAFAARGAKLALADFDVEALEQARVELAAGGSEVLAVPTDVRDRAAVQALADATLEHFGAAHIVCNNAGIFVVGPLSRAAPEQWKAAFDVNFWGVVHGVEAFLPHLLERGDGHIVNTASMAGLAGMLGLGIYCSSKFAVVGYSESLQREIQPQGVGVSVLCPMIVQTNIGANSRRALGEEPPPESTTPDVPEEILPGMGSVISPEEVAGRVVEAIEERRFFVLTHPEQREILRRRAKRQDAVFERL